MRIYLAGPLFTEAERQWHRGIKLRIEALLKRRGIEAKVIWPYELLTEEEIHVLGHRAKEKIFTLCRRELLRADMLVALLDGPQVDDGTAWEIGCFHALRQGRAPILGVRTDFRRAGETEDSRVNAMIEMSCDTIAGSGEELLDTVARIITEGGQK